MVLFGTVGYIAMGVVLTRTGDAAPSSDTVCFRYTRPKQCCPYSYDGSAGLKEYISEIMRVLIGESIFAKLIFWTDCNADFQNAIHSFIISKVPSFLCIL